MKQQQLITYLNINRVLICLLIFSQICTFSWISFICHQEEKEKLNARICAEEIISTDLVPLEIISEDELK